VINRALAPHSSWGDGCDSWLLNEQDGLHVMEERMRPGKAGVRHLHRNVRRLYFVLAGTATVCFDDREELFVSR
jgi:mannose-6-phosphate isomerase-like protein (cupin superfamily)